MEGSSPITAQHICLRAIKAPFNLKLRRSRQDWGQRNTFLPSRSAWARNRCIRQGVVLSSPGDCTLSLAPSFLLSSTLEYLNGVSFFPINVPRPHRNFPYLLRSRCRRGSRLWGLLHRRRSSGRRGNLLLGRSSNRCRELLLRWNMHRRSRFLIIHITRMVLMVVIHRWLLMHPGVGQLFECLASRKQ